MAPTNDPNRQRIRVLCVDDEPTIREVLALHLRRGPYEVATAPDGLAAIELLSADTRGFDVIIADNQVPRLDGIGLVERLRAEGFPGKIVFFSSTLAPHHIERVAGLVDAVVEKGRPVGDLMSALGRVIGPDSAPA